MVDFYEKFNIQPLRYSPPDLPTEIGASSQEVIIEQNRFAEIADEDKEAVLYELDKVLKPGGHLIFRESSKQQTLIEYYGEELLAQKYRRVELKNINSGQIMVYKKDTTPIPTIETTGIGETNDSMEDEEGLCKRIHSWYIEKGPERAGKYLNQFYNYTIHLIRKKHRVNGEIVGEYEVDETLKETLSLSWFRKAGLLQPLMSEFGGDVEKALDFIVSKYSNGKPAKSSTEPLLSGPLPSPDNSKTSFTIEDLAKELGVSIPMVRRALNRGGVSQVKTQSRAGRTGFGTTATRGRRLIFSPSDYPVVRDMVKQQLKQAGGTDDKGN